VSFHWWLTPRRPPPAEPRRRWNSPPIRSPRAARLRP
jgi:hypothetical protein